MNQILGKMIKQTMSIDKDIIVGEVTMELTQDNQSKEITD